MTLREKGENSEGCQLVAHPAAGGIRPSTLKGELGGIMHRPLQMLAGGLMKLENDF